MSHSDSTSDKETQAPDGIGQLIKLAGAREAVPPERLARARSHVHAHWQAAVCAQRPKAVSFNRPRLAVAATVLLTVGAVLSLWHTTKLTERSTLANVERVVGQVFVSGVPARVGATLALGTEIETTVDGRIAVRLPAGQSLRLDGGSRLSISTADQVALDAGAVYLDSAPELDAGSIIVTTPLGVARDIGTQFQVRLATTALIVGVREGLVEVARDGRENQSVQGGEFLELAAEGQGKRRSVASDDPSWKWVESVAPEFELEGATLEGFLNWYARERGLRLRWEDTASQANARANILHGSIADLNLDETIDAVSRTAQFEYRIGESTLWVTVR